MRIFGAGVGGELFDRQVRNGMLREARRGKRILTGENSMK
jgi:hypothetical protein